MGSVYLVMLDVAKDGCWEHAVIYSQREGYLERVVASVEAGPFDGYVDLGVWLGKQVRARSARMG